MLDSAHANLPATPKAFGAYLELLQQGRTSQLSVAAVRGERHEEQSSGIRKRPARMPKAIVPPATNEQLLGPEAQDETAARTATLRVTVLNGDLSFVRQPLLLGHYRSSKLTGAEWVMNELIGGAMAASLAKGQYPDAPESHQAFTNTRAAPDDPRQLPRPEAVVIVGLGEREVAAISPQRSNVVSSRKQRVSERASLVTPELAATLTAARHRYESRSVRSADRPGVEKRTTPCLEQRRGFRVTRATDMAACRPPVADRTVLNRAAEAWRALQMTADGAVRSTSRWSSTRAGRAAAAA